MGKTTSKLDKRRSQSISWSHKFGSLNRNRNRKNAGISGGSIAATTTMVITSCPHLDVPGWLSRLDLDEYQDKFKQFNGVEDFLYYSEADIKKLGVRNNAHRARIISSLVALRENPSTGSLKRAETLRKVVRHSVAVDSSRKVDQDESHDAVYECLTASNAKQSKSLGDLLDMETTTPDGGNESVALKKALEWELSLDSRDLRSHAWYHGPIPRQRAEEIVQKDGDFLVRDCVSQPGNYVLTCRTKGPTLHFVINKLLIQPETVYERVQYQFEDDAYDTVPDLITFYVGSGKSISAASGARIQFPCNRLYPLSFYASKYGQHGVGGIRGPSPLNSPSPVPSSPGFRYNPYTQQPNTYRSPMSSPPRTKRETPPRLPSKKQRSQSLTPLLQGPQPGQQRYCSADGVIQQPPQQQQQQSNGNGTPNSDGGHSKTLPKQPPSRFTTGSTEKCNSADGVIHGTGNSSGGAGEEKSSSADGVVKTSMSRSGSQSLPRSNSLRSSHGMLGSRTSSINKESSEHSLSPCIEQKQFAEDEEESEQAPSPPPKPIRGGGGAGGLHRKDSIKEADPHGAIHRGMGSYHPSGSDSGNGSGDSAQSSAAGEEIVLQHRGGVILKNPRFIPHSMSSITLRSYADFDPLAAEEALLAMTAPVFEQVSRFDLENFNTLLLPFCDFKPLDSGTLSTFRMMLHETGSRVIATHLTRVDISLILEKDDTLQDSPLNCTGLELITLEQGRQFRLDLIERTECIKLLVAVTILTCQDDLERAETLNKWIQVAVETKTALGNLFGFCAIMLGLSMPQIQKLETTWHTLRQKYTDSAFNFEAKLRPTLNSMNDCSNPQAPNTTIPHILPYILVKDRTINDVLVDPSQSQSSTLVQSCVTTWETISQDFGFSILFAHLDAARSFVNNLSLYKKNAAGVMQDTSRYDALLEDAFRTEFQVKFLWGCKGCFVPAEDRHAKFEHVLTVMADKFCGAGAAEPVPHAAG